MQLAPSKGMHLSGCQLQGKKQRHRIKFFIRCQPGNANGGDVTLGNAKPGTQRLPDVRVRLKVVAGYSQRNHRQQRPCGHHRAGKALRQMVLAQLHQTAQ